LNEEEEVLQDVDKYFDIQNIIKRGTKKKAPDVFRFDSTRVIAKIKDYSEAKPVAKIAFEIQIKSAFEYAWSITTHSLTYKTNKPDWKRDRLAAQLKASVEQLDTLVLGFEDMSNRITESYHELSIEKVKLSAFIADLFDKKILPEEHFPKDMSRNCDNMLNLLYACPWYRKPYDKDRLEKVILFIRDKLSNLQHIPRTLSLFQLFYCCLAMEKDLSQLSDSYFSFITKDMISFMPKIEGVRQRFATETP
jgi:hypothetical protein